MVLIQKQAKRNRQYEKAAALIGESLFASNKKDVYPEELQLIENETNVISSLVYVPSYGLREQILINSFSDLCKIFKISGVAMYNRLFNYFLYELDMNYYQARKAVGIYRADNKRSVKKIRKFLIDTRSKLIALPF